MFTGIIESSGKIISLETNGSNKTFWIESDLSPQLKIDESVCHNGVCLTIEEIQNDSYRITAIKESITKTNIKEWQLNDNINLERSMLVNGRIDGHFVQGHVDCTAICIGKKELNGSREFTFNLKKKYAALIVEKGSVCINGVSLTAFNVTIKKITVAIIPYTFEHTNFSSIDKKSIVNIEFDILGKYVQKIMSLKK